jgi:hypothetical protein
MCAFQVQDDYPPYPFDDPPPKAEHPSVWNGTVVTDFNEYTFRAPRPGLFAGDWMLPYPSVNPIRQFRFHLRLHGSTLPGLGAGSPLERLPRELLHQILALLDPCTVVAFAGASVVCRRAVLSLRLFKEVALCPRLLATILYLRCRFFSFGDLTSLMSDTRCRARNCPHYGDILYLVMGTRLCYDHWRSPSYCWSCVVVPKAKRQLEIDAIAAGVPHVRIHAGTYGNLGELIAKEPCIGFHARAMSEKFGCHGEGAAYKNSNEPARMSYPASLQMPYYDEQSGTWEEGFLCRACAQQGKDFTMTPFENRTFSSPIGWPYPAWGVPSRRYTRTGMMQHIEEHGRIFKLPQADGTTR